MRVTILLAVASLCSCDRFNTCEDDDFTLVSELNANGKLKVNGYYIGIRDTTKPFNVQSADIVTLFTNGVKRESGTANGLEVEQYYSSQPVQARKSIRADWDRYQVHGTTIVIEDVSSAQCGLRFRRAISIVEGQVLSDTCFEIYTVQEGNEPKRQFFERFLFREYAYKLDSTNKFL